MDFNTVNMANTGSETQASPIRMLRMDLSGDPNGGWRVGLELRRDANEPEPAAWRRVKRFLAEHEFVPEDGPGLGEFELFLPRSFFSADIALCATRVYEDLSSALCGRYAIETLLFRFDRAAEDRGGAAAVAGRGVQRLNATVAGSHRLAD